MEDKDIFINTNTLNNMCNAIRFRTGFTQKFYPEEMSNAVLYNIHLDGIWLDQRYGGVIQEYPSTDLRDAYKSSTLHIGMPIVTNKTHYLTNAFRNCQNLYTPSCSPNIYEADNAYYNCQNLVGPAVMGLKREEQFFVPIGSSGVFFDSTRLQSAYRMYENCVNLVGEPVFGGSATVNLRNAYSNCHSLNGTTCYFAAYNYGEKTYEKDLHSIFANCYNYRGHLNKQDPNVYDPNMHVTYFQYAFRNCYNITGEPIAFKGGYTSMALTYFNCNNLTGNGCCGENVTSMQSTFSGCTNLNGIGISGANVKIMSSTYKNCINLAAGDVGVKVTDMNHTFYNCYNMKGSVIVLSTLEYGENAFYNCSNLSGIYMGGKGFTLANFNNIFNREVATSTLKIVFDDKSVLTAFAKVAYTGCTMSKITKVDEVVSLPLVSWRGREIDQKDFHVTWMAYNEEKKIYMYSKV